VGRRVLVFDELESTNSYAAELAGDPDNAGVAVLARVQTAGRGQHGRTWTCPPNLGVLLSALLFPPAELRRPVLLTAWAAVAVCQTIQLLTGKQARIKWPNYVLVDERKICGILIEQGKGTVAGIGLNVNQGAEHFAAAGLPDATSLALLTQRPLDWNDTARLLIRQLDETYTLLLTGGGATLEAHWQRHLALVGCAVRAECIAETHQGRLLAVGWNGVGIAKPDGEVLSLVPERIVHLSSESSAR
jgi:BirA family biotin operon repressor/biotin-[acetyl-CoA-carboxylase] ligase